jgi:hypothetical protein
MAAVTLCHSLLMSAHNYRFTWIFIWFFDAKLWKKICMVLGKMCNCSGFTNLNQTMYCLN